VLSGGLTQGPAVAFQQEKKTIEEKFEKKKKD
jgi:hypothetical protein